MKRLALALGVASCVDTAPGYQVSLPTGPTVTEVGVFHLADGDDDVHDSCAPAGARDVSFEIAPDATQTVMFDTDPEPTKTTTAVAMSLFDGPCPAKQMIGCTIASCGAVPYGRLVATLQAQHTYCLVVEQADPASALDLVTLRVFGGGRPAALIFEGAPTAMGGTTCMGDDAMAPAFSCASGGGAPSSAALVPVCPGQHHLTGTVQPAQPVAFSLHAQVPPGPEVACFTAASPGAIDQPEMLDGPQPYWLLIERATSNCGSFQLTVGIQ